MDKLIVVASHKIINADNLNYPYMEVYRGDFPGFNNTIKKIDNTKSPTIIWSEYAQFLYAFPLPETIKQYGFVHYRAMFDLDNYYENFCLIDYKHRATFFKHQEQRLEQYINNIVVGKKMEFQESAWQQFVNCHPNSEELLRLACRKFDTIFNNFKINSEQILKQKNYIYCRNMFISPDWFANSWKNIAIELIKYLDDKGYEGADERWGGFVLERLFSCYVYLYNIANPNLIIERPIVFFEELNA